MRSSDLDASSSPSLPSPSGRAAETLAAQADGSPQNTLSRPSSTADSVPYRPASAAAVLTGAGLTAFGAGLYHWLSSQPSLPPLADTAHALGAGAALFAASASMLLLSAKLLLGDRFHMEVHRGRLYLSLGVPSHGPPIAPGAVCVHPTGDVRGNGAFAAAAIPAGTHIGDYSGDRLDRAAFFGRYPDGVGDYAMAVDDEWVIDGARYAPDTTSFHPVHMNHSRVRPNIQRFYRRGEGRVSFFATCDIAPGQELLYDYGRDYWRGREHLELP